jgi:tRNA A-37 threonylcarbamoyl transferase component Bud32
MNTIDKLGAVNQAIAELEATARKLKAELISKGVGVYNGELFTAEVQHYDRATINPRLVREVIDPELISSVTEIKAVNAVVVRKL